MGRFSNAKLAIKYPIENPPNPRQCKNKDCGQYMGRPGDLQRHMEAHNPNALRYPCPVAGCTRPPTLQFGDHKEHMEKIHGIFLCGITLSAPGDPKIRCVFETRRENELAAHKKTHKKASHDRKRKSPPFVETEERPTKKARRSKPREPSDIGSSNAASTFSPRHDSTAPKKGSSGRSIDTGTSSPAAAFVDDAAPAVPFENAARAGSPAAHIGYVPAGWSSFGANRQLQPQGPFERASAAPPRSITYPVSFERGFRSNVDRSSIRPVSPPVTDHYEVRYRFTTTQASSTSVRRDLTEAQAERARDTRELAAAALRANEQATWSMPRTFPVDMRMIAPASSLASGVCQLQCSHGSPRCQSQSHPSPFKLNPASWASSSSYEGHTFRSA